MLILLCCALAFEKGGLVSAVLVSLSPLSSLPRLSLQGGRERESGPAFFVSIVGEEAEKASQQERGMQAEAVRRRGGGLER